MPQRQVEPLKELYDQRTDAIIKAAKKLAFEEARIAVHSKVMNYFKDNQQYIPNTEAWRNAQIDVISIISTTILFESSKL